LIGPVASSGRKERRVPCKKPVLGQRLLIAARGVEHRFDDSLHIH
jgi:hypothetical protein